MIALSHLFCKHKFPTCESYVDKITVRHLESVYKLCNGPGHGTEDVRHSEEGLVYFFPQNIKEMNLIHVFFVGKKENKILFLNLHKRINDIIIVMCKSKTIFIKHGNLFNFEHKLLSGEEF